MLKNTLRPCHTQGIPAGQQGMAAYNAALIAAWRGETDEHPFLLDSVFDLFHLLDVLTARGDVDARRIGMTGVEKVWTERQIAVSRFN